MIRTLRATIEKDTAKSVEDGAAGSIPQAASR